MTLLWSLSAGGCHASSAREIARLSGLPLANAIATRATGLELPGSHSYQWLWQIIERCMLRQLDTFLAALQRVPPRTLVLETLAQIFKAVVDLPDQQHAHQILARFHHHQLLAHDVRLPGATGAHEAHAIQLPLLPYVMAAGKYALARWLLSLSLDINRADANGRTALHYAAGAGQTDIVNTLLQGDARLDAMDNCGRTPLHEAAQGFHVDAMKAMLTWPAFAAHAALLHVRDQNGCTPVDLVLQHAPAAHAHPARAAQIAAFCTMLFTHGTDVSRLLIEAIDRMDVALFRHLYETCLKKNQNGDPPFLRMTDDAGRTPLLRALAVQRFDIVNLLLEEGADVLYTSPGGNVLHTWISAWLGERDEASMWRMLFGLEILLEHAWRHPRKERLAWINHQSGWAWCGDGMRNVMPPLHMACLHKSSQIASKVMALLLKFGADPMQRSWLGQSVLEVTIAAALEDPQDGTARLGMLYRTLGEVRWQDIVNAPNFEGISPLRALLRRAAGGNPLPPAAYPLIDFLCAHGAAEYPDVPDQQHITKRQRFRSASWGGLHAALHDGDLARAHALLSADPGSVNDINEAGQTPLMLAIAVDADKLVSAILYTEGLNLLARDALGWTALHHAAHHGRFEIACVLVMKEPRLCQIKGGPHLQIGQIANMTPLHLAAQGDHHRIVDLLLKRGTLPMVLACAGGNFVHQAAAHGALHVVELLIRCYPDLLCRLLAQRTALPYDLAPIEHAVHHRATATPAMAERIDAACGKLRAFQEARKRMLTTRRSHRPGDDLSGPPRTSQGRASSDWYYPK